MGGWVAGLSGWVDSAAYRCKLKCQKATIQSKTVIEGAWYVALLLLLQVFAAAFAVGAACLHSEADATVVAVTVASAPVQDHPS